MNSETSISINIPMEELLQRLNVLNGSINLLTDQLDIFSKTSKQSHEEQGVGSENVFAGFALLIPDLSSPIDRRYLSYVHGGAFIKQGDEYFEAGEELVKKWSSWTIAQSYEAFETFLRDISAYFYYKQRPQIPIGALRQIPIEVESLDAWRSFFRERKWDPSTILNLLRLTEPKIEDIEKHNILSLVSGAKLRKSDQETG